MAAKVLFLSLVIAALWVAWGCSKGRIAEKEARGWYQSRLPAIEQLEHDLRDIVGEMAWFSAESGPGGPRGSEGWDAERDRKDRARAQRRLDVLAARSPVLGIRVMYSMPANAATHLLGEAGRHPRADHNSAVHVGSGFTADGRDVGWGLFQLADKDRPGLEVRWTFTHGPATFTVDVALLADDE